MRRSRTGRPRPAAPEWWQRAQEVRALRESLEAEHGPLDAKTLKQLHAYNAWAASGRPPTLAMRVRDLLYRLRALLPFWRSWRMGKGNASKRVRMDAHNRKVAARRCKAEKKL